MTSLFLGVLWGLGAGIINRFNPERQQALEIADLHLHVADTGIQFAEKNQRKETQPTNTRAV